MAGLTVPANGQYAIQPDLDFFGDGSAGPSNTITVHPNLDPLSKYEVHASTFEGGGIFEGQVTYRFSDFSLIGNQIQFSILEQGVDPTGTTLSATVSITGRLTDLTEFGVPETMSTLWMALPLILLIAARNRDRGQIESAGAQKGLLGGEPGEDRGHRGQI